MYGSAIAYLFEENKRLSQRIKDNSTAIEIKINCTDVEDALASLENKLTTTIKFNHSVVT
jgi:hypothetical protein